MLLSWLHKGMHLPSPAWPQAGHVRPSLMLGAVTETMQHSALLHSQPVLVSIPVPGFQTYKLRTQLSSRPACSSWSSTSPTAL